MQKQLDAEPDWAVIEADYQADDLTVNQILKKHNITLSRFYRYADDHGWQLRTDKLPLLSETDAKDVADLVNLLRKIVQKRLIDFETATRNKVLKNGGMEFERQSRGLAHLARVIESLAAIEQKTGDAQKTANGSASQAATATNGDITDEDPATENWRWQLAAKLERIVEQQRLATERPD